MEKRGLGTSGPAGVRQECSVPEGQHHRGLRDKAATAGSTEIQLEFTRVLEASDVLDDLIVTAARGRRGLSAGELRLRRNKGPSYSVKLPLC